jgi:hypothetical protein
MNFRSKSIKAVYCAVLQRSACCVSLTTAVKTVQPFVASLIAEDASRSDLSFTPRGTIFYQTTTRQLS